VGSQYRLTVGNEEFYIDLLFYHLKLRAYVVVDLKMKAFEPEFAGKMNFYLSAVNDLLRHPDDQPTNPLAYPNTGWPKVFPKNCKESCQPLRNWRMNWGQHPKRIPYDLNPA